MDAMTPPDMLQAGGPAQNALQSQMAQALVPQPKPVTHDVTIVTTRKLAQAKVMGVPPEEFGIERGARDIKSCNYCFHEVVTKTEGQLIAEGFDEEQIKSLGDYTGNTNSEILSRDSVNEHLNTSSDVNSAARLVKITEHYVRMDYEGNGRPCLYMVVTGGDQGEILKRDRKPVIEPIDVIPFAATTPVPITHRFFGRSIADLVMPAQREKTALKRGALDNLYLHNNPRVEVPEAAAGANTLDDLLVSRPGGIVRTKGNGGMLNWQVTPDITGSVYPMMQYIDAELETRTGLSKQTQGIDANALQNQSATAVAQVFSASQMRVKLIARIMAEGVRDIFSLLHHTIRSHGQEKQTVRLRNQWIPVDPRNWKTRNDMTINVGLGSGGKSQMFAQAMALLNIQKELLLGGKTNLVDDQALFNSVADVAKIMGHKNADKYINDPSEKNPDGSPKYPPPPPREDPKITAMKLKAQTDQMAAQHKAEIEKIQAEADIATQDRKTQAEMAKTERDFDLKAKLAMMQAQLDAELKSKEEARKEREFELKIQFEREKHQMDIRQAEYALATSAQQHEQTMAHGEQTHKATMEKTAAPAKIKSDAVKGVSEKVDAQTQALTEVIKQMSRPKKIVRDKAGKAMGVE